MAPAVLPDAQEAARVVVGPGSVTWERGSDVRTMLGAGAALLLQVSHPTVGAGVHEHSTFLQDPWGRLLRTLDYATGLVYAGPHGAPAVARGVREGHRQIRGVRPDGARYHALEPEAYAWVHATLAYGILETHRRYGRALGPAEAERFWAQWRGLGRLLGIRDRDLPPTLAAFWPYVDAMVAERLEATPACADVLATLEARTPPPVPHLPAVAWAVARLPAARLARLATIDLLPGVLRERLGLRLTALERTELRAFAAATRAADPLLPRAARCFGPGYLRWRGVTVA
jgi:uncharacterized protein (DUF2236 family)